VARLSEIYILDTGALFSTWTKGVSTGEFLTVSGVLQEIRNKPSKLRSDILMILEQLKEEFPASASIKAVKSAAQATGDYNVLSEVDVDLLALAYTKKSQGLPITLVSSDLAVLNTARRMGIAIIDPSGRFQHEIVWSFKCPACNHKSKSATKDLECPVCGTQMRRIVSRKKKTR